MIRVLGWLLLLVSGILSLPLLATVLDEQGTENWILPVQLVVMALLGGAIGLGAPGFVGGGTVRRFAVGAAYGVAAAAVGLLVFFVLLSGLDGA